jgi:hypothetical protein
VTRFWSILRRRDSLAHYCVNMVRAHLFFDFPFPLTLFPPSYPSLPFCTFRSLIPLPPLLFSLFLVSFAHLCVIDLADDVYTAH